MRVMPSRIDFVVVRMFSALLWKKGPNKDVLQVNYGGIVLYSGNPAALGLRPLGR
jgi:hypothetical protein